MREIKREFYSKENGKYTNTFTCTDEAEIYKDLASVLISKKLHSCTWVRSIKDTCNYDGTRTITVYHSNGCKDVYTVADR